MVDTEKYNKGKAPPCESSLKEMKPGDEHDSQAPGIFRKRPPYFSTGDLLSKSPEQKPWIYRWGVRSHPGVRETLLPLAAFSTKHLFVISESWTRFLWIISKYFLLVFTGKETAKRKVQTLRFKGDKINDSVNPANGRDVHR